MKVLRNLREIAKELAPHLPAGYALAPKDKLQGDSDDFGRESCRLTRPQTFTEGHAPITYVIQLSREDWRTIQIEGQWPRSKLDWNKTYPDEHSELRPATTVDRDLAPEQIAKNIQPFLRAFEKTFKQAIEDRRRKQDAAHLRILIVYK
jgi:hypothetical protein